MKIIELLERHCILANLQATNKQAVLEELAATLVPGPEDLKLENIVEVLLDRERLGSTAIGDNIAIPHGKLANLTKLKLAFGRSVEGVDYNSMDGKPTHLFFLLLAPINSAGMHLKALAKISRMLMTQSLRASLMNASSVEEIHQLLMERDAEI